MAIIRKITNTLFRSRAGQGIDDELRAHVEMRIADNIAAGMSPAEARRDALIRFGNPSVMKERVLKVDVAMLWDALCRDLNYGVRQLRKAPAFTLTAVLTLAVGIGANAVVFGVLNSLILRPLDVSQPARLYNIEHKQQGWYTQSYPDFLDFRSRNRTFTDMAAYSFEPVGMTIGNSAYQCWFYRASGNYFDMLGVQPALGRFFHASDEHGPNSAPYIVLSDVFWRSHFNADPRVIGLGVQVNKHPFTVIGVAPKAFHGTDLFIWPDFWMPLVDGPEYDGDKFLSFRGNHNLWILGELKPAVTIQQATDDLNFIATDLARQYPLEDENLSVRLVRPGLMGDLLGGPTRAFVSGIMVFALLVLLAACTNLASVFAARAADRSRELAIRLAIGSSRWHIVRQLLMEAVLVSVIGGAVGTVFSVALLRALSRWQPFSRFPVHVTVTADTRVYLIALLLSFGSGLLFALLPLRQVWHTHAMQVIKGESAGVLGFRRLSFRDFLLGIQIALCTLLVTASLVALRGMQRSLRAPLGFQPDGVLLAETDMHMAGYTDDSALPVQKRMLEVVARIPGVVNAGTIDETPLGPGGSDSGVYPEGTTDFRPSSSVAEARYYNISPGYMQAAGTRLLAGRDITWHDDDRAPRAALVNARLAHILFGNGPAVGRHFMLAKENSYEVIGVVEDGKYESLTEEPWSAIFFPLAQNTHGDTKLVVRSALPPSEIVPALNRTLTEIDPSLPFIIETWPAELGLVLFPARVATAALGVLGVLAAMLALTGIFGAATYAVSKRIRELSIRVALGAQPIQVMRSALGRSIAVLLSGSAAGLTLGLFASQLLAKIVYHSTPRDPVVLGGVTLTMTLLGLLATWIPARHALRIDPAELLREQ